MTYRASRSSDMRFRQFLAISWKLLLFSSVSVVENTALKEPRMVDTTMDSIKKANNISIRVKPDAGCGLRVAGIGLHVACCGWLDAGCGMLDAGCWIRDTGCWMLDTGCWMLDAGCGYRVAGNGLRVAGDRYSADAARHSVFGSGRTGVAQAHRAWRIIFNGILR